MMNETIPVVNEIRHETEEAKAAKNLAINQFKEISVLKERAKVLRDTLQDNFDLDQEYFELADAIKELRDKLKIAKERLMQDPENTKLETEIKDVTQELKDAKADLSSSLIVYRDHTQLSFFDAEGFNYRIVLTGTVKRKQTGY